MFRLLTLLVALLCATPNAIADEVRVGRSTGVEGRSIGGQQFIQLSEEVTRSMLSSDAFLRIVSSGERPRFVVGNVSNRTNNETIMVGDITRRISEVVIESGQVRWFEYGANEFDLIASPVLSGTMISNGRRREFTYTLTLTLSDVYGEVVGRWSATRAYVE